MVQDRSIKQIFMEQPDAADDVLKTVIGCLSRLSHNGVLLGFARVTVVGTQKPKRVSREQCRGSVAMLAAHARPEKSSHAGLGEPWSVKSWSSAGCQSLEHVERCSSLPLSEPVCRRDLSANARGEASAMEEHGRRLDVSVRPCLL